MIVLYSIGCPQCNVLKEKLKDANIEFVEVTDKDTIIAQGIKEVPVLDVDGVRLDLLSANEWIKNRSN